MEEVVERLVNNYPSGVTESQISGPRPTGAACPRCGGQTYGEYSRRVIYLVCEECGEQTYEECYDAERDYDLSDLRDDGWD